MTSPITTDAAHEPRPDDVVAQYYRDTRWHYRGLWSGPDSAALHYGYWSPDVSDHVASLYEMNAVLADRAGIRPGERVLDAGCGVGGSSVWLATHRGVTAHGINIEPGQVYRARENAARAGVGDRATFSVDDLTASSFPDGSFDVVWAVESACYARDKSAFCREAARLLAPGGRLVVADFFRAGRHLDPAAEQRVARWFRQWMIDDLDTLAEFAAAVAAAGLVEARIEDATPRVRRSARRLFAIGCLTAPIAGIARGAGLSSDLQHANWLSTILQYTTLRRDLWRYGIVAATRTTSR